MLDIRDDCWASNLSRIDGVNRGSCDDKPAVIVDDFYDSETNACDEVTSCPAHEKLYYQERPFRLKYGAHR